MMNVERLSTPMTESEAQTEEGAYRCEACEREFESREALEEHVNSVGLVH